MIPKQANPHETFLKRKKIVQKGNVLGLDKRMAEFSRQVSRLMGVTIMFIQRGNRDITYRQRDRYTSVDITNLVAP